MANRLATYYRSVYKRRPEEPELEGIHTKTRIFNASLQTTYFVQINRTAFVSDYSDVDVLFLPHH